MDPVVHGNWRGKRLRLVAVVEAFSPTIRQCLPLAAVTRQPISRPEMRRYQRFSLDLPTATNIGHHL
jgi:hypothetical protein